MNQLSDLILGLSDKSSSKRRSAAKKIRKLKVENAVQPLIDALKTETRSPKTWETQYQMIMALGEIGDVQALDFLYSLLKPNDLAYMVNLAVGDSITRLEHINNNHRTLTKALKTNNKPIVEGGLRAIALLHAVPDVKILHTILNYVKNPDVEHMQFWVAVGAANWKDEKATKFLHSCLNSSNTDTVKAAKASMEGKFLKWNPL